MGRGPRLESIPIHDDSLWTHLQLIQGTMHREDGSIEDIDLVDFLWSDDTHSPGNGIALDDLTQLISPLLGKLLRVVQQIVLIILWQYHRCRIDTACQTTTPSFVATRLYLPFVEMTLEHTIRIICAICGLEHLCHAANAGNKDIDLFLRIVKGERSTNSARDA